MASGEWGCDQTGGRLTRLDQQVSLARHAILHGFTTQTRGPGQLVGEWREFVALTRRHKNVCSRMLNVGHTLLGIVTRSAALGRIHIGTRHNLGALLVVGIGILE